MTALPAVALAAVFTLSPAAPATPVAADLTGRELAVHFLDRVTFGHTEADLDEFRRLGLEGYVRRQLSPTEIPESSALAFKLLALPPAVTPKGNPRWQWQDLYADQLLRARYSARQLNEVMAEFWANHFNTSLDYSNAGMTGFFSSLAYDARGRPAIADWDGNNHGSHVNVFDGKKWRFWPTVDDIHPDGMFISLRLDPVKKQLAAAFYQPRYGSGMGVLRFSRFNGKAWTAETVDDRGNVGAWSSLRFTRSGQPRIAYQNVMTGAVRFASSDGGAWRIERVDLNGRSIALALDAQGQPAIAYYDDIDQALKFARRKGRGWTVDVVAPMPAAGVPNYGDPAPPNLLSLELDPLSGGPALAWYDPASRHLTFSVVKGKTWRHTIVDDQDDVGLHPSLAFDPRTRRPAIAYFDRANYHLKYARFDGVRWKTQVVDDGPHITGEWCSLAFDPKTGRPAISFHDGSKFTLDLATWTGKKWTRTRVESLGTGRYTNVAWAKDERQRFRDHALGRFRDLLEASATSPAMMIYLNNNENNARAGNENYARELLELHTLGVDGGYTQKDVETVARAFTGWTAFGSSDRCDLLLGDFCYNHGAHDSSPKTILGVDFDGDRPADPENYLKQGHEVLDLVARHPSTARFLCKKLIQKFVADDPPERLWDACAETFTESGGDIACVLETVLYSREIRDPDNALAKIRTPLEYTLGTLRHLEGDTDGLSLYDPMMNQGLELFRIGPPTGYAETGEYWINSNSFLERWKFADRLTHEFSGTSVDLTALAAAAGLESAASVVDYFLDRLVRGQASDSNRQLLLECLSGGDPDHLDLSDPAVEIRLQDTVALILTMPEYLLQ